MSPTRVRYAFFLACCGCGAAPTASAQYEVEGDDRFWLRAVLDVRLVEGPAVLSWTDGGPGKIRYGGDARIELSQLALEFGASLPGDLRARAQVNVQNDIAGDYTPWIVEANLRKEWDATSGGWGLQAGIMNLPFSLEHTGAAWSPELTISASALNSWLWEDVSLAGVEGEWWQRHAIRPAARRACGDRLRTGPVRALAGAARLGDRRRPRRFQWRPAAAERNAHGYL